MLSRKFTLWSYATPLCHSCAQAIHGNAKVWMKSFSSCFGSRQYNPSSAWFPATSMRNQQSRAPCPTVPKGSCFSRSRYAVLQKALPHRIWRSAFPVPLTSDCYCLIWQMLLFLGHGSINIDFEEEEFIGQLLWFLAGVFDSKDCWSKHQDTCFWRILNSRSMQANGAKEVNLGWRWTGLDAKCHLRRKLTEDCHDHTGKQVAALKQKSRFHGNLWWMLISCSHEGCAVIPFISSSCFLPADVTGRGFLVSFPYCELRMEYHTCWWHTHTCLWYWHQLWLSCQLPVQNPEFVSRIMRRLHKSMSDGSSSQSSCLRRT